MKFENRVKVLKHIVRDIGVRKLATSHVHVTLNDPRKNNLLVKIYKVSKEKKAQKHFKLLNSFQPTNIHIFPYQVNVSFFIKPFFLR